MADRELREELRLRALCWRQALTQESRAGHSAAIAERIAGLDAWRASSVVMLYRAFRFEVDTDALHAAAVAAGKTVVYPRCLRRTRTLELRAVSDLREMVPGAYGIAEPDPRCHGLVDPASVDLVVIPVVAFDSRGYRLGYGAGYYDRFLPSLRSETPVVAAAFAGQRAERIPVREGERPAAVVTEEGALYPEPE